MSRKSMALTVPSEISTSYVSPVRLSLTDRVSSAVATPPPSSRCVCSSAISLLGLAAGRLPDFDETDAPARGGVRPLPVAPADPGAVGKPGPHATVRRITPQGGLDRALLLRRVAEPGPHVLRRICHHDRATADVDRDAVEWRGGCHLAAAADMLAGPEVDPLPAR